MTQSKTWSGKVALITGGSRGIGRAIAEAMGRRGAKVAISYRSRREEAEEVVDRIRGVGGEAVAFAADLTTSKQADALVGAVYEYFGSIEILVNNAGITQDGLLTHMTDEMWEAVLAADLSSAFYCTRTVVRGMMRQRFGRIVQVGSVTGVIGNAGQSNYAAAKGGLISFSKAVAREVAHRGVTVNVVAPGYVETELTLTLSERVRTRAAGWVPMHRFATVQEVASAVCFFADPLQSYITGQVLCVDGGIAM
ncbi:MAG: 3-oxoacyl-[acyl-carrier-protein] reductase [Firmicutes bacterium]|nr:3-oxoacyl-[acyl-carrier-protein] reductase [Bacillota bacterium]